MAILLSELISCFLPGIQPFTFRVIPHDRLRMTGRPRGVEDKGKIARGDLAAWSIIALFSDFSPFRIQKYECFAKALGGTAPRDVWRLEALSPVKSSREFFLR